MENTYLLINFLTVLFPIILSFDKRVRFYQSWKYIFPGLFISGLLFLFWDYLFTIYEVWSFNPDYIRGIYFLNLPLEEILFFVTVPFACIFIYECLNYYIKRDLLESVSVYITYLLMLLCAVLLVLFFDKVYSLITFSLLLVILLFAQFVFKLRFLSRFYLAYLVSLIPFYIVNGLLTSIPVVMYNNDENMSFRVGTIPFEDHFYSMAMLLLNIMFFKYFRRQAKPIHE
ncbi:lycopene cyclase domain-containing protein [Daejeonella sp.]|uniref:lycopene cyclase domain-containing protein n=1 Tax=Daejeonella sp. TaxID=2805397 RepID=UPI002723EDBF|nr:lycopene cyclase domain-containing protein [Daejeonella sp.]MDO8992396.1 lycopene cyclase domain-containing protein [Daejeonella sp.]MDP2412441.1 lycopene cyclase domain-containing protein [Daejeonella sp.]